MRRCYNRYHRSTKDHKRLRWTVICHKLDNLEEIDKFLEPYKSRIVCTIHDEIVYEIYKGEEFLIPKIKAIMENLEGSYIPMVSEVEITTTTWDEKK